MAEAGRIERTLDRFGLWLITWPATALLWVGLAVVVCGVSLAVHPEPGTEQLYLGNLPFGSGCDYRRLHGVGCYNCGMTRSWVFAARGAVLQAFAYNAAGATLFYGTLGGGLLGAVRLALRRHVLPIPWSVLGGVAVAWLMVWGGMFGMRQVGWFPLPPDPDPLVGLDVRDDLGLGQPSVDEEADHR